MDVVLVKKVRPTVKQASRKKRSPATPRIAACFLCHKTIPETLLEAHVQQCLRTSKDIVNLNDKPAQPGDAFPEQLRTSSADGKPSDLHSEGSYQDQRVEQPQNLPPEPPSKTTMHFFDTFKFAGPACAGAVSSRLRNSTKCNLTRPPKGGAVTEQNPGLLMTKPLPAAQFAEVNGQSETLAHEVEEWLCGLQLGGFFTNFLENGFDTLTVCSALDEADLDCLNVLLPGARKKLLLAAADLRRAAAPKKVRAVLDVLQPQPAERSSEESLSPDVLDVSDDAEKGDENRPVNCSKRRTPPKRTPNRTKAQPPPRPPKHALLDARNHSELARSAQAAFRKLLSDEAVHSPAQLKDLPGSAVCRTADDVRAKVLQCLTPDRPPRSADASVRLANVSSQVFRFFSSSEVSLKYQAGTGSASSSSETAGVRSLWATAACPQGSSQPAAGSPTRPTADVIDGEAIPIHSAPQPVACVLASGDDGAAMAVDLDCLEEEDKSGIPLPKAKVAAPGSGVQGTGGWCAEDDAVPAVEIAPSFPFLAEEHLTSNIGQNGSSPLPSPHVSDCAKTEPPPLSVSSSVVIISPEGSGRGGAQRRLAWPMTPKRLNFDLDPGATPFSPSVPLRGEDDCGASGIQSVDSDTKANRGHDASPQGRSRLVDLPVLTPAVPTPQPRGPAGFWDEVRSVREDCWKIYLMKRADAIATLWEAVNQFDAIRDELLRLQEQSLQRLCQHYGVDARGFHDVKDADLPALTVTVAPAASQRCEVLPHAQLRALQRRQPTSTRTQWEPCEDLNCTDQREAPSSVPPSAMKFENSGTMHQPYRIKGADVDSEHESEELFSPDCRMDSGNDQGSSSPSTPVVSSTIMEPCDTVHFDPSGLDFSPLCGTSPPRVGVLRSTETPPKFPPPSPCISSDGAMALDAAESHDVVLSINVCAPFAGEAVHPEAQGSTEAEVAHARKACKNVTISSPTPRPMPDYDTMPLPELKRLISTYGVKPKSRDFMVAKLKQIWTRQHGTQEVPRSIEPTEAVPLMPSPQPPSPLSQATATQPTQSESKRAALHRLLVETIKQFPAPCNPTVLEPQECGDASQWQQKQASRQTLYERILLGETVDRDEVLTLLLQKNVRCPKVRLEEFLDSQGVSWKRGWKRQRREPDAEGT